jgi:hypothetical protein
MNIRLDLCDISLLMLSPSGSHWDAQWRCDHSSRPVYRACQEVAAVLVSPAERWLVSS